MLEIEKDISVIKLKEAIGEEGIRNLLIYIKNAIAKGINENKKIENIN